MRHRVLTFGLAVATALAITAPASAQIAVQRYPGGSYGNDAYQNGYREGVREGERDARDRKDYGYKRDDAYEDADRGYRGGSKNAYRNDFRRGYESGYDVGYRRAGGYGYGRGVPPSRGDYGYPGGGYPGGGYPGGYRGGRIAFDNGYADGYDAGRNDADHRRSFEPEREGRYRSGNRGYDSRYGSRDSYRNEYRNGFRSGYEAGFRAERRNDRWR